MMTLHYSSKTKAIIELEDRLKKLSLAYNTVLIEEGNEPLLKDGSSEYPGIVKMNTYLDQLDEEKEQWYYCDC